jgi:DNA polymerase
VEVEMLKQVIRARLAVARVTKGKPDAVLNRVCCDGRLRGVLAYWAAHTGRWGGRAFQPQNLTRPIPGVDYEAIYAHLNMFLDLAQAGDAVTASVQYLRGVCAEAGCDMGALMSSLLRGVIVPGPGRKLCAVDYSAVEARGLLWLAGDEAGLDIYRRFDRSGRPEDHPYILAAADIYGVTPGEVTKAQRQIGKVATLACGYGGSIGAFEAMAGTYGVDVSELDVEEIVNGWRDARAPVAGQRKGVFQNEEGRWVVTRRGGLWKDLERTVRLALSAPAGVFTSGRCSWHMEKAKHLICTLPSGRPIVYRDCRIEVVPNQWGKDAPAITYFGKQEKSSAWGRHATYGGKLSENITQAATRDLMADAMVKLEAVPGVDVVLSVHDELLCEVLGLEGLAKVEAAMLDAPAWAAGLPLAVEGGMMKRYGK